MSLPTAVFLDTSIFAGQQYNFTSTALASFIPVAKQRALKLLLPAPTQSEILRQIRERSSDALKALEDARRRAPFLAKWKHFPPRTNSALANWEVMAVAMAEWHEFLKKFDVLKLDYSSVNLDKVMRWYDAIVPPFRQGKKRKEFPDAFAIEILEAYARENDCVVAVVSEDADFQLACDRFSSLLYFNSLPSLTELLLADSEKIEKLRTAIVEDLSVLENRLFEEASGLEFYHSASEYSVRESKIHGATITEVRIVAFGIGECTLTFEAEIEAEHLLRWEEWDHDDSNPVEEKKWVIETSSISGTAKVAVDLKTNTIKDVISLDSDIGEIEVTENPHHRW